MTTEGMIDIEQYFLEHDTTQMENMLQMIDPAHGIIIDKNIGLLGEFKSEFEEDLVMKNMHARGYEVYTNVSVGKLNDKHSMNKRGDFFKVIDADGCILFDEYITDSGIIYKNNELYGYIFVLKDYKASQVFDIFFDDEAFCPAVVIYANNKLYINKISDDKLMKKFEYRDDIKIEYVKHGEYKLEFENIVYYSYVIEGNNSISIYKTMQMQL